MVYTTSSGLDISLSDNPIKTGGEGSIYEIIGKNDSVAKIYHGSFDAKELEEKITIMMGNPPNSTVRSQIAWPSERLYDAQHQFIGIIMPKIDASSSLFEIYNYNYPPILHLGFREKLIIAQNICVVIDAVHKGKYIFGDFNPKNIGVNLNTGRVGFFDIDSFHIVIDKDTNTAFRCKVCAPGYVAPELLAKCKKYLSDHPEHKNQAYVQTPLDTFTQETDLFALANHIFRLLMNGSSPYTGIKIDERISTASPGIQDEAVSRDSYCFKPGNKPHSPIVLPFDAHPPGIGRLLSHAFIDGRTDPKKRPSAIEWYQELELYEKELKNCSNSKLHQYYNRLKHCPWCEADDRYKAAQSQPQRILSGRPTVLTQKQFASPIATPVPNPGAVKMPVRMNSTRPYVIALIIHIILSLFLPISQLVMFLFPETYIVLNIGIDFSKASIWIKNFFLGGYICLPSFLTIIASLVIRTDFLFSLREAMASMVVKFAILTPILIALVSSAFPSAESMHKNFFDLFLGGLFGLNVMNIPSIIYSVIISRLYRRKRKHPHAMVQ